MRARPLSELLVQNPVPLKLDKRWAGKSQCPRARVSGVTESQEVES